MAVVAEEVVVRGVEVDVFLAVASECGVPGSEDRELAFHGVCVDSAPSVFA